jgi:hypothetical protein
MAPAFWPTGFKMILNLKKTISILKFGEISGCLANVKVNDKKIVKIFLIFLSFSAGKIPESEVI